MPQIITIHEARSLGLKRYFTGERCKHGHISERQVSDRQCISCKKEKLRINRKLIKDSVGRNTASPMSSDLPALPKSRKAAIQAKSNYYFTNKRCHKGHLAYRVTSSGSCSQCEHERMVSEKGRAYQRQHYVDNAEIKKKKSNDYYHSNLESGKEARRIYYQKNKAVMSMQAKLRKRGLVDQYNLLSAAEKLQIKRIYEKRDMMNKEAGEIFFHVDHIVPISKGGKHHPSNLQILTSQENLSKGAKLPSELAA